MLQIEGSPPRMRGKVFGGVESHSRVGITPACAGKSVCCRFLRYKISHHPRVCGEKLAFWVVSGWEMGSPPHVRGKG